MTILRRLTPVVHRLDHALGRLSPNRDVLVELRTPVYHAVLAPIAEALAVRPGLRVWYTSEDPDRLRPLVPSGRFLTHRDVEWRRFDLYINADPWAAARLRRCARRVNFFHGVAGKYVDEGNPEYYLELKADFTFFRQDIFRIFFSPSKSFRISNGGCLRRSDRPSRPRYRRGARSLAA